MRKRVIFLAAGLFAGACARLVNPIGAPDNHTVAFLSPEAPGATRIVLFDASSVQVRSIAIPAPWKANTLTWIDNKLLIFGERPLAAPHQSVFDSRMLDPATEQFTPTPISSQYPFMPFAGRWQGKACIFSSGTKVDTTDIRALPDFAILGSLDFPVEGLRDGWMLHSQMPAGMKANWSSHGWMVSDGKTAEGGERFHMATFEAIDVLDGDAKVVMQLDRAAIKAAFGRDLTLFTAALSPDHRTFLLAPRLTMIAGNGRWPRSDIYPYGYTVFEVATGKRLYAQKGEAAVTAPAVLADEGIYAVIGDPHPGAIDAEERHTWLTLQDAKGIQRLVELPVPPKLDYEAGYNTTASPDGKTLFITWWKPKPQLCVVPLRPDVKAAELRVLNLPK